MAYDNFSREELGEVLSEFLDTVNFKPPPFDYDFSFEKQVLDYFRAQPWPAADIERGVKIAKGTSAGAGCWYPFADEKLRIAISIHGAYVFLVDDAAEELGVALDHFTTNLILGRRQESPILQSLVDWLSDSSHPFKQGSFLADMNIKCTIDHIRGCVLERDYDGKIVPPRGATNFPRYLREKTGLAESYALFCFPDSLYPESNYLQAYLPAIQDLCDYINYTNDILSFYKESVIGTEQLTYVPSFALTHGIDLKDAFRRVTANVAERARNIRVSLADYPELLRTTEEFLQNYIVWHLDQPRYRLGELVIRMPDGKPYQPATRIGTKVNGG